MHTRRGFSHLVPMVKGVANALVGNETAHGKIWAAGLNMLALRRILGISS